MKQIALGAALSLVVCLGTPAFADSPEALTAPAAQAESKVLQPAPLGQKSNRTAIGTEVPSLGALTQKTVYSLAALSMLFLLVMGTYKRFAQKRGTADSADEIQILARKPLGTRQALMVVSVGGQKFFVSQGNEQVTLISELEMGTGIAEIFAGELEALEKRQRAIG